MACNIHSACIVFDPVRVDNFAFLLNCTPVGPGSDYVMDLT